MILLWSTRGRDWGFSFLTRPSGTADPLKLYQEAFGTLGASAEAYKRLDRLVAVRFTDPEGRRDRSGRLIPHEFVLGGRRADDVSSAAQGISSVWPLVADRYRDIWESPKPPPPDFGPSVPNEGASAQRGVERNGLQLD